MFRKNAHLTDNDEIESKLALGEFVRKGTCVTNPETESTQTISPSPIFLEKVPDAT